MPLSTLPEMKALRTYFSLAEQLVPLWKEKGQIDKEDDVDKARPFLEQRHKAITQFFASLEACLHEDLPDDCLEVLVRDAEMMQASLTKLAQDLGEALLADMSEQLKKENDTLCSWKHDTSVNTAWPEIRQKSAALVSTLWIQLNEIYKKSQEEIVREQKVWTCLEARQCSFLHFKRTQVIEHVFLEAVSGTPGQQFGRSNLEPGHLQGLG